jgi:alkanesulfonate monooxygenase SsuD/methylene tetrahydromethanopterin reductase-like flavin-dependent oxidoreductase (luciferase family)
MRVGVLMLPTDPWPETRAEAQRIDALGYDHLWTYDHLSWRHYRERSWHASMVWLTGMAAATERIRIGTMVTSPNFRHPVTLAKEAMSLDHVSGGRLVLGVGAGGVGFDATVLGGDVLPPGPRTRRLAEFVETLDLLLRQPAASHRGEFYVVDDARMIPGCVQQPRLPIAVAAAGPRTLALTARFGDAWITYGDASGEHRTPAETEAIVRDQMAVLDDACAAAGRDPNEVERIYMIGNTDDRPTASVDAFVDFAGRYRAMGFTDVVYHHPRADDPVWDDPPEMVERIALEAMPQLR